jgi:hypothetical protein
MPGRVMRSAAVMTPAHRRMTPRRCAAGEATARGRRGWVEVIVQAVVGEPCRSTVGR